MTRRGSGNSAGVAARRKKYGVGCSSVTTSVSASGAAASSAEAGAVPRWIRLAFRSGARLLAAGVRKAGATFRRQANT